MEKFILIGASGFVGSAILKEALDRQHPVSAIVRNPEKIITDHPLLEKKKADVSDAEMVMEVCRGAGTVISAYNPGWKNPLIYEDTLRVYSVIIEGAKKAGVKRLLIVGGAGSLFIKPGLRLMDTGIIPDEYMPGVKGHAKILLEKLMQEKELDWVYFSPAGTFVPGKRTGKFRLGKDDLIQDKKGDSRISVEDYAVAMLNEAENPLHHRERFTIGY